MSNALTAVDFPEANCDLQPLFHAKNCEGIRVCSDGVSCISCWKMSFRQRMNALIYGTIWLSIKSGYSMPGTWISCEKSCFRKDESERRRKSTSNGSAVAFAVIAIISLIVAIGLGLYMLTNPPPLTGRISGKDYHPSSYPVMADTPWVHVLTITTQDGKQSCSWIVNEDTYNSYSVGDNVTRGVHGHDNDTAATPGQGAS